MNTQIQITDTAYGGSGVGRDESGKAVFIPYTVTGDVVIAEIIEEKPSFNIARLKEIVTPSPMRTEPHCEYYGICGGCNFGHIRCDDQLKIKENILRQALRKLELPEISIHSAHSMGYRIRATLRLRSGKVGFYAANSQEHVTVTHCPVMKPTLFDKAARWAAEHSGGLPLSLSVLEAPSGETIALAEGSHMPSVETSAPFIGIKLDKKNVCEKKLLYETDAGKVPVAPGGFFQANQFLINEFQTCAAELAGSDDVVELYAGSGFFTAAFRGKVKAVESNAMAARIGAAQKYPIECGDSAQWLKGIKSAQVIFADPPREGIDKKTMREICRLSPERMIYVSCNPMTLGRDLGRMEGYSIESLDMFDMFPHTYHVETVVSMRRLTN